MAKTSDAQLKAIAKWQKEKVEEIKVRVPIGKKSVIQEFAKRHNESVNGFINRLIDEAIKG